MSLSTYPSICSTRSELLSVGRISHDMNELLVIGHGGLPFERGSFEVGHGIVFAAGNRSEWACGFEIHRIDGFGHAGDFAHRVTSIGGKHVTESVYEQNQFRAMMLPGPSHFSFPSPPTIIRWLSEVHARSLIEPENGWNSFFNKCSLLSAPQIRTLPWASEWNKGTGVEEAEEKIETVPAEAMYAPLGEYFAHCTAVECSV